MGADEHGAAQHHWYVRALLATLAGLLMSAALAFVLTLGQLAGFGPFQAVERAGVDLGMNIYVDFSPLLDSGPRAGAKPGYLFVDVDDAACQAFQTPAACTSGQPVSAPLILDFVRSAREANAAVVILDAAPPADPAQRQALAQALSAPVMGPWIIAPLIGRPTADGVMGLTVDPTQQIIGQPAQGRLRLALMSTVTDAVAGDGVLRQYPIAATVHWGASPFTAPSAPWLAARLTDPATAATADCSFYAAYAPGCAAAPAAQPRPAVADEVDRVFFTLPSLALASGSRQALLDTRYLGFYERVAASTLLVNRHFALRPDTAAGRVVVLGSSAPGAEDLHVTPLGAMAGPEVILNATRAFHDFAPLIEPRASPGLGEFLQLFGAKLLRSLQTAAFMVFVWLAIFALFGALRTRGPWLRFVGRLACVVIFLGGMATIAVVEVWFNASDLRDTASSGRAVDFLTPVFAQGLEGYSDGAKFLTEEVEKRLVALYGLAWAWFVGVPSWLGRVRKRINEMVVRRRRSRAPSAGDSGGADGGADAGGADP